MIVHVSRHGLSGTCHVCTHVHRGHIVIMMYMYKCRAVSCFSTQDLNLHTTIHKPMYMYNIRTCFLGNYPFCLFLWRCVLPYTVFSFSWTSTGSSLLRLSLELGIGIRRRLARLALGLRLARQSSSVASPRPAAQDEFAGCSSRLFIPHSVMLGFVDASTSTIPW